MRNFIQINIEKNKTDCTYSLQGQEYTLPELIHELQNLQADMVHVTTYEQERILLEGYLSFSDKNLFVKRLKAAGKAQA